MYATAQLEVPRSIPISVSLMLAASIFFRAQVQFEFPAPGAVFLQTTKFECAEFSNGGLQVDRDELAGFTAEGGLDGRNLFELLVAERIIDHVANSIFT